MAMAAAVGAIVPPEWQALIQAGCLLGTLYSHEDINYIERILREPGMCHLRGKANSMCSACIVCSAIGYFMTMENWVMLNGISVAFTGSPSRAHHIWSVCTGIHAYMVNE